MKRSRARKHRTRAVGAVWLILLLMAVLVLGAFFLWGNKQRGFTQQPLVAESTEPVDSAEKTEKIQHQTVQIGDVILEGQDIQEMERQLREAFAWKMTVDLDGSKTDVPDVLEKEVERILEEIDMHHLESGQIYHLDTAAIEVDIRQSVSAWAELWRQNPVDSQVELYDKVSKTFKYTADTPGRTLDEERLVGDIMEEIKAGRYDTAVTAYFNPIPPARTQAQAKEQYKVIGSFTTKTTDNKNRNENIRLAGEALDGIILKAGEEFSFNLTTGNRTKEKGYRTAGAYRNGVLIEEPGGGVCQVSTTLYHAIIESGFMITERNNHSFAPSYVKGGQDAMVSYDGYAGPDLKFVNNSKSSIAIRTYFKDRTLKLSIVGLPILEDGVHVEIRSEKIEDVSAASPIYEENAGLPFGTEKVMNEAQKGSVWRSYRVLKKGDQVLEEEPLYRSNYRSKSALIQRNTLAPENMAEAVLESTEAIPEPTGAISESTATVPESSTNEPKAGPGSGEMNGTDPAGQPQTGPGSAQPVEVFPEN